MPTPTSTPPKIAKSASYLLRLTPQEKAELERKAADRNVTLAEALRTGAAAYLADLPAGGRRAT